MFLYRFVCWYHCCSSCRLQTFTHVITPKQIFQFLSFLGGLMALTYRLPDRFSSWPWHWIFKVKDGICYISAKMVWLPWIKKKTYWLNYWPLMWQLGLALTMTLFYLLYFIAKQLHVFHEEVSQLPVPTWYWEVINVDIFLCFLNQIQHKEG